MFAVELTYRTRLGNLTAKMTNSQTVETRDDAEQLRNALKELPQLADATISIKNAKPLPTLDEAMQHFRQGLAEYPALVTEKAP